MIGEYKARELLVVDGMKVEVERIPALAIALFADGFTEYIWADEPHSSKFNALLTELKKDSSNEDSIKWVIPISHDIFRLDIWVSDLSDSPLEEEKIIQLAEDYFSSDFGTHNTLEDAVLSSINYHKNMSSKSD